MSNIRLFCFPHAGAGAAAFRGWGELSEGLEVLAVRLPGRESRHREPLPADMNELVASLASTLEPYLDLPFAFFGDCSGSLLAFELARWLRRAGSAQPLGMFVVSRGAPQATPRMPSIHQLPTDDFLKAVAAIGGIPAAIAANRDLMQLLEPVLRSDFRLFERYRYVNEPPLDIAISVFGRADEPPPNVRVLAAWHAHTRQRFTLRLLSNEELSIHPPGRSLLDCLYHDLALCASG